MAREQSALPSLTTRVQCLAFDLPSQRRLHNKLSFTQRRSVARRILNSSGFFHQNNKKTLLSPKNQLLGPPKCRKLTSLHCAHRMPIFSCCVPPLSHLALPPPNLLNRDSRPRRLPIGRGGETVCQGLRHIRFPLAGPTSLPVL